MYNNESGNGEEDTNRSLKMWSLTSSSLDAKEKETIELESSYQTLKGTGKVRVGNRLHVLHFLFKETVNGFPNVFRTKKPLS